MTDKVFRFSNGVRVLNCTKHALNFQDGDQIVIVEPSGFVIDASIDEQANENLTALYSDGDQESTFEIVTPTYCGVTDVIDKIDDLRKQFVAAGIAPVLIIGSQIAAQAYPGLVAALVPVAGFERVPWDQKRMRIDKFTMF